MSYRVEQGHVTCLTGPMFCGKSTEMMRQLDQYQHAGNSVALVKHKADTRYTDKAVVWTHSNQSYDAAFVTDALLRIVDRLRAYQVIAIDEAHFYPDVVDAVQTLASTYHRHVIVCGLNGDYRQRPFANMQRLFACCDKICHYHAVCKVCAGDAPFTICKVPTLSPGETQLRVGAGDMYEARCRGCLDVR